jgi:hypothetical protein
MTRFDLEAAIMKCWTTADDLDMLAEHVLEEEPSTDTIVNTLLGIQNMHEIRMTKIWNIFSALIAEGQFTDCQHNAAPKQPPAHEPDGDNNAKYTSPAKNNKKHK